MKRILFLLILSLAVIPAKAQKIRVTDEWGDYHTYAFDSSLYDALKRQVDSYSFENSYAKDLIRKLIQIGHQNSNTIVYSQKRNLIHVEDSSCNIVLDQQGAWGRRSRSAAYLGALTNSYKNEYNRVIQLLFAPSNLDNLSGK